MPLSAEDRLAITEVIARYCHATDGGDGEGVAEQFTENGILEITGAWQARGHQQIVQIGNFPNKPKHWVKQHRYGWQRQQCQFHCLLCCHSWWWSAVGDGTL